MIDDREVVILPKFDEIPTETQKEIATKYASGEEPGKLCSDYYITTITLHKILRTFRVKRHDKPPKINHRNLVFKTAEDVKTPTNTVIVVDTPPRPDILVIDWDTKTISAIEVETLNGGGQDMEDYKNKLKLQLYTDPPIKPINKLIIVTPNNRKEYNLTPTLY